MEPIVELCELLGESRSTWPKRPWAEVESELGLELPADYKCWGGIYASMAFGNSIAIDNYSCLEGAIREEVAQGLGSVEHVVSRIGIDRVFDSTGEQIETDDRLDAFYPEVPGLLGWGAMVGGGALAWYTKGRPDEWKTVVVLNGDDYHLLDLRFAEFLVKLLKRTQFGSRLDSAEWYSNDSIDEMWGYRSVTAAEREFRATDFRTIGTLGALSVQILQLVVDSVLGGSVQLASPC